MKKIVLFLGALLLVFSFSCKKKNLKYTIKGTIYDSSFNTPLSGASVSIYVTTTSNSTPVEKVSLVTDAAGNYSYELEREKLQSETISVMVPLPRSIIYRLKMTTPSIITFTLNPGPGFTL